jgi:hypothetical protein
MVNPNRFYTYAYLREDRTPYYVGKGVRSRLYSSNRTIKKPKDKSRIIFLKQNLTEEEAFKHEIYMIAVLGRKDLGTGILHNKTSGGEGGSGAVRSEEFRRNHSERFKGENSFWYGKTHSEEHRRKNSEANMGENNHFYGKSHSEENKRKISIKKKGKPLSEETKRKQSEAKKGKCGGKNHSHYGKKWWNDSKGNTTISAKCPGENWVLGRGKKVS